MCGIFGYATTGATPPFTAEAAALALQHRGPDATGIRASDGKGWRYALGSTRLRIIDVTPGADQPISNESGDVWVVYNGELYNHGELRGELRGAGHSFSTSTDTEVLVHLYEEVGGSVPSMLERIRGMFAFALFDESRRRFVVARDRLGIKPLYWAEISGGIAFSSEVRALVRAGAIAGEPSERAIGDFLVWGSVSGPETILSGVHELGPGSFLDWSDGRHVLARWWQPTLEPTSIAPDEAERRLEVTLRDSVRRHLIADRPVGIFLSGGTDSSAIALSASEIGPVRTLTVTFDDAPDEGDAARRHANEIGADHREVRIAGRSIAHDLHDILRSMDQPTVDGVNTWIVSRAAREDELVVALSGLGGDELFGGYPTFSLVPRTKRLTGLISHVPEGVRRWVAGGMSRRAPGGRGVRAIMAPAGLGGAYRAVRGLFAPMELPAGVVVPSLLPTTEGEEVGDVITLLELSGYMSRQLLRDTDQMSMAHSLEVRVPLLDDELVRFVLGIPPAVRMAPGKQLLARAAGLDGRRPKRPFALPFDGWIRGPLAGAIREGMGSESLPFADVLPREFRARVYEGFLRGRVHWSRPWAITVLRMWPEANGFRW